MKTLEELTKEHKQKRKKLARELKQGMTTVDALREVVEDLFNYSDAQVLVWGDEIIIATGYGIQGEVPKDSEDMRKKGDLKVLRVRPGFVIDGRKDE